MKVLTISNVPGSVDNIVDVLDKEGVSVVAKEGDYNLETLAQHVSDYLKQGNFGIVIVVPDDYVGASMLLNKYDHIRAALCSSRNDIEMANRHNVNTIILKSTENLSYLINGISKNQRSEQPTNSQQAAVKTNLKEVRTKVDKPIQRNIVEQQENEQQIQRTNTKQGIVARLKDSLGIIDD